MTVEELTKLGITEELAKKVVAEIDAEYVKSGNYIPKAKFDQVLAEKNQLKAQVDQAGADLAKLKRESEGNETLKQTIENLQKQHKELEGKHKAELLDLRKRTALLADLGPIAHNPNDIVGFVDISKVSIDDNGTIVGGWDDQKAELLKSKPYMFKATPPNPNPGVVVNPFGSPTPNPASVVPAPTNQPGGRDDVVNFAKEIAKGATTTRFGSDTYFGGNNQAKQ